MERVVLNTAVNTLLSEGAWALVGLGLLASQHPIADDPHPVPR